MSRDPIQASKLEARPVEWLWRDRIPKGMITLVAGRPDQGKGLFAAFVAAEVSKRGMNVLYSAMEDDPSMMTKPRLEAAGANLDRVLIWRFLLPKQQQSMEKRIRDNDVRLVVIDPLAAHMSGGIGRGSDAIRHLTNPMSEFAEATGCSFLIVEHVLKRPAKSGNPLSAIAGGSSGLPSASRMGYLFGSDPKDPDRRILAAVKSNLREKPKALEFETDATELDKVGYVPYLLAQQETEFDPGDLLHGMPKDRQPGRPPEKRAAASEWLSETLYRAGKPLEASMIYEDAKQYGLTTKTVRNAAKDIGVVKNPPGGGRKCKWSLPAEIVKAMDAAARAKRVGSRKAAAKKVTR